MELLVGRDAVKIIFLDVDGVLNHPTHWGRLQREADGRLVQCDPACVHRVLEIVQDTAAGIVVSSTHRLRSIAQTKVRFNGYGFPTRCIVGVTPALARVDRKTRLYLSATRGQEIQAWLDARPGRVDRFVIVDDDCDMGDLASHHVRIDPDVGLTPADAIEITRRLS